MVSGKMDRWVQYLLFPLMGFFLYILLGVFCPAMVSDVIFGNGLVYALAIAIFGVWAFRHRRDGVPDKPVKFSLFGWLVILTVFIMMYLTAEGIGNYLYQLYPVGSSDVYANMKGSELTMYLLFGCTIGREADACHGHHTFVSFRFRQRKYPQIGRLGCIIGVRHGVVEIENSCGGADSCRGLPGSELGG